MLLAQGIGRVGNWFNVELFGRPLDAPWALEVPARYRPSGYSTFETFHPTFAYEAIWCTLLAFLLIAIGSRLHSGQVFSLYVLGYSIGRLGIESIRIDSAHTIGGLRLNIWVSLLVALLALMTLLRQTKKAN